MSWHAAVADPVFRLYVIIILSLLALGGVLLGLFNWGLKKNVSKVWPIWRSWLLMAPLGLLIVALGHEAMIAGIMLLALAGFREYARATGIDRDGVMSAVIYLAIVATGCVVWIEASSATRWSHLLGVLPIYVLALIWLVPVARNRVQGQLRVVSLAMLGFLCIGWMFGHLGLLARSPHAYGYIVFIVFAVEICDISAWIFGKSLGRRAFRSNISPNKTWGGAVGALGVAMALPWVLGFSFPPAFDWRAKVLTGLIIGLAGPLGDLSISLIKRDLGIKDMGAAIPGHGGILDRIDSLIFVAPLFTQLVRYFEPF